MIDLNTGETLSPAMTALLIVVIVIALAIALNMRKKIERNEDRGGLLFTPEKLRIVPGEEEFDGEMEDNGANSGDEAAEDGIAEGFGEDEGEGDPNGVNSTDK